MIIRHGGSCGMGLDILYSFDGTEETTAQIKLAVEWRRNDKRVLLDIAHPFISELAATKDARLFELIGELVPIGLREIEEAIESERQESSGNSNAELPRNRPPGYIYLIKSGDGYYKIGCTKNVRLRKKDFGVQLPFPFEILHIIPAKDMYQGEASLHERYAHCRLRGEWFSLTEDDVKAVCVIAEL